jgi:hypothetical protein
MTTRERFQAIMNFQSFDRLPILEWAEWWDETIDRWHNEGLPKKITDRYEICQYFDLDMYKQDWFPETAFGCPKEPSHGAGIIKSEKEYDIILKHLYPADVVDKKRWEQWAKEQSQGDIVIWFTVVGFFWFPRTLFGIEQHLYSFYDFPKLMHRMNSDLTEWILKVVENITQYCEPDFMTFAEDMSYNHGPMLSNDMFDEFIKPYYEQIIPVLKKHNIIPILDSDGDISEPAYWFEDVGIDGVLPLERQAGVDMNILRQDHPKMKFIGHYDKMVMNKGEDAIRSEFERLVSVASKGGYIVGCDHQTPPGVSLDNYKIFLSCFREYAEKIGRLSQQELA